jgi:hypothetical protein
MAYELQLPDVRIVATPTGVVNVIPGQVQPVTVVGQVDVVQPVTIAQPVEVFFSTGPVQTVNQGEAGVQPWPVTIAGSVASLTATTTAVVVGTSPIALLGTNLNRKGFAVQNTSQIVYVKLDSTASTDLYSYELPRKGILEIENYCGPVSAVTLSGAVTVMVTEKV